MSDDKLDLVVVDVVKAYLARSNRIDCLRINLMSYIIFQNSPAANKKGAWPTP